MIYFVRPVKGGPIKIGTSTRLTIRLAQLESEHDQSLEVVAVMNGSFDVERDLHERFAAIRLSGEWFASTDDLLAFIAAYGRPWDGNDEAPPFRSIRLDDDVVADAKLAASLMRMSLADYASDVIRKAAEKDIAREARKLTKGGEAE